VKRIVGYSSEEIINGGINLFFQLVVPDDYIKVKSFFIDNILEQGRKNDHSLLTFKMNNKWGLITWLECKFFKNIDLEAEQRCLIGILKDITRQIQSEQYLWKKLEENVDSLNELKRIKRNYKHIFNYNGSSKKVLNNTQSKFPLKVNGHNNYITKREKEILHLIANGFSTKQIASRLHISYHTVVSHRKNILSKFKVQNTAELITKASNSFWL